MKKIIPICALLLALAARAQNYALDRVTVAGGGGASSGGSYAIGITIAQPGAGGTVSGGEYAVTVGFWAQVAAVNITNYSIISTVSPPASGLVSGDGTFAAGSTQSITATPGNGFKFIAWTGDATGASNPLMVTLETNVSLIANFAATGTNLTLSVITNGDGAVTPNENGRNLKPGKHYLLTAKAAAGNVFSNWTGSITTNQNPLNIAMNSSMALQANFIPNPFPPFAGTYNGLFAGTNGIVTEQTAGMIKGLRVNAKGTYSGTLLLNGAAHGLAGSFNLDRQASKSIVVKGEPVQVALTLNAHGSFPEITGTVSGSAWTATLVADLAANTLPSAKYTMLLPPDTNTAPGLAPEGNGYAAIGVQAGTATVTGALADGAILSQTVPVSQDGYLPLYNNLYGGKGLLLGWINLDLTNTAGVSLTWIHPARDTGLYHEAFTNVFLTNQILLSPWTNSAASLELLGGITNLLVVDSLPASNATAFALSISPSGEIGPAPVAGSVKPKTGVFSVTFGAGATGHGVILLNTTNGGGYFQTITAAGAVELDP